MVSAQRELTQTRTMEEILEKLLEHFGFAAPFAYAALAYGLFYWLDENASDEAKAALARTMSLNNYKDEQVASALVEVFDRIYTYPLLRWRAFFRSLLFTAVVSAIYSFEVLRPALMRINQGIGIETNWALWPISFLTLLLFNAFTDYLSLFLIRSGTKPVIGLALGAVSGAAIVLTANLLRILVFADALTFAEFVRLAVPRGLRLLLLWPVTAVFAWLPLFALGIVIARLLTPLSWIVGRTQWFLKEGNAHPLKAIGYVAAVVVFLGTVAGRAVFNAL